MRVIQRGDLLPLSDLNTRQLHMVSDLAEDINAETESRGGMSPKEVAEVLERLAAILRKGDV
jgi:hypothetical protein